MSERLNVYRKRTQLVIVCDVCMCMYVKTQKMKRIRKQFTSDPLLCTTERHTHRHIDTHRFTLHWSEASALAKRVYNTHVLYTFTLNKNVDE